MSIEQISHPETYHPACQICKTKEGTRLFEVRGWDPDRMMLCCWCLPCARVALQEACKAIEEAFKHERSN